MSSSTPGSVASPIEAGKLSKTAVYYTAFVVFGMIGVSMGPTLPALAENTQSTLGEISILFAARSFGRLIGASQAGRYYDRLPGHILMAWMFVMMALLLLLVPVISLLWLLAVVMLGLGLAAGAVDLGGNTLLVWVHGDNVGPFMNGLHFAFGVGAFLTPIIIAQVVLLSGDVTGAFWVLSLLTVPVIIWLFLLPSPAAPSVSEAGQTVPINFRLVLLIALFFFLYVGAEVGYGGWIFSYAATQGLTTKTAAAYLTSAFFGTLTVGRLIAVPIAARFRPRTILFSDFAGCLISLMVILLWPTSTTALWLGTLGLGLSMASIFPTMLTFAGRRMTITGRVNSWIFSGGSLGAMFWPWFIGQLFEYVTPQAAIAAVLVNLAAAVSVLVMILLYSSRSITAEVVSGR